MKTSCLRLKLVELNFFGSFNADGQRKTYVSSVSKYKCDAKFGCHFFFFFFFFLNIQNQSAVGNVIQLNKKK